MYFFLFVCFFFCMFLMQDWLPAIVFGCSNNSGVAQAGQSRSVLGHPAPRRLKGKATSAGLEEEEEEKGEKVGWLTGLLC